MKKNKKIDNKLTIMALVFTIVLFGLGGRVYYIKNVHGEEYEMLAKTQQVNSFDSVISPNRGAILDRNKQAFAVSTTVYNIVLDPLVLVDKDVKEEDREKTLKTLSSVLSLDYNELKGYITIDPLTGKPKVNNHWKVLKKGVSREIKEELESQKLKGVVYQKDTERRYVLDTVACHVLGFIRGDTKWGLEQQYDSEMSGIPGRSFITYDGSSSPNIKEMPAEDGNTIVTTLDYSIQQFAEEAVAKAVADYDPENAAILVMDPNTGEVLAMASAPEFNNNSPSKPLELSSDPNFAKSWETMSEEDQYSYLNNTWKNFNTTYTYEPGSIFKPMVIAAALEENIITTDSTYYCSGVKQVYDRAIHCWNRSGHGAETLEDLLKNSCNVGMMDIGNKMGRSLFYKYQKDFGFGDKTGIDLPGEVSASTLMFTEDRIGPTELATMSFGQSFNCTTLQAMNAFSAVINGGNLMKPYVVSQILDSRGNVIRENKPEIIRKVISQKTSDIVRVYLKSVISSPTGTGKKAKIEGYSIGGKTGTGEQGNRDNDDYTVTFVAFLPVEDPQVIAIAVIDRPSMYVEGSTSSAPILKGLLEKIIKYKNIEPEYESEESKAMLGSTSKVKLDDYKNRQLFEVLTALENNGLKSKIVGTGNTVTSQAPHEGTEVEDGSEIILYVSKGEGETGNIQVPNLTSIEYEQAVGKITELGLQAVIEGDDNGVVISQEPKAGISVDKNTEVKIVIEKKQSQD